MRREIIPLGQLDLGEVGKDKVAAFGLGVGNVELVKDLAEAGHFALHLGLGLVPEVVGVGLLEANGGGFLERGDGRVADACVGCGHGCDEFGGADEVADAPAGGVEVFACGADG